MVHFIHIGKTGGSAIQEVLHSRPDLGVRTHPHEVGLAQIPPGEPLFFAIRHPVPRFVSGFNSRFRRGRPRNDIAWRPGEEVAFTRFTTPNALAEALGDPDAGQRQAAETAMAEIEHARPLQYWLHSPEVLAGRRNDILMVCEIESLDADFALVATMMNWSGDLGLPRDPVRAHVTPDGFERSLSEAGHRNLLAWYEQDVILYGAARLLRAEIIDRQRTAQPFPSPHQQALA